jgi:hypothetical protein
LRIALSRPLQKLELEPLPSYFTYTPQHWRQRASELRVLANTVDGHEAQETMLRIAQHYDRLAIKAEEQSETFGGISPPAAESASNFAGRFTIPSAPDPTG